MSAKPAVISLARLEEAVREGARVAEEANLVLLTERESRDTSGGALSDPGTTLGYTSW